MPPTEKRGRVHTSTVTVAIIPDSQAKPPLRDNTFPEKDLSYRWHSGTGAGGQHRNKHQNCLELTHIPTGIKQSANGRVRVTNEADALANLRLKVDAYYGAGQLATTNNDRSGQIGSGMRGDKRRTYRFQDDSVTDHETGKTVSAKQAMKGRLDDLWA